jgi:hypothetical protein
LDFDRFDADFFDDIETFSTDKDGQLWLLGEDRSALVTRSQLGQESFSPLPKPTPYVEPTR